MISINFDMNKEKSIEVILYVATRVKNPTLHTIFKIMYFADKLHISKYGRFITGDSYIAMEYGPVPGGAYDITKNPPPMIFKLRAIILFLYARQKKMN